MLISLVPEPGIEPGRLCYNRGILSPLRLPVPPLRRKVEATPGFEPGIKDLQSSALPLGYVAKQMERKTGIEPATLALARRCSTAELLPQNWCREAELNCRHADFQSAALPTELSRLILAELTGLEPAIFGLTGRYVNHLHHSSTCNDKYTKADAKSQYNQWARKKFILLSYSPFIQEVKFFRVFFAFVSFFSLSLRSSSAEL